jgi:hypothetical protein
MFSVPLVVLVRKVTARSFWIWLAVGGAMGPFGVTAMLAIGHYLLLAEQEQPHVYHGPAALGPFVPFVFWISWSWIASTLASFIYLNLLRRMQRDRDAQVQPTG